MMGPTPMASPTDDNPAGARPSVVSEGMIPLARLPARLRAVSGRPPPSYLRLALLARDGELPAEWIGLRFYVRVSDIPAIARALGLVPGPVPQGDPPPRSSVPDDAPED